MATVLIVDDSHLSRTTARLALARAGVAVIEATDGVAGVEAVARHRPDCVVVSLAAPALDALGFLRALKGENPPPVIVLAQCPRTQTVDACLRHGAREVVERSFDCAALLRAVDSALAARPARGLAA